MNHPIGVFDSGYGGLSILKEIVQELPEYDYLYLGDNARAPYGTRSFNTVYKYTLQCVEWFFRQGCPLVVLACNTASAKALRSIQQNDLSKYGAEKRVLGVIRPTSEVIGNFTKTGHVGIVGTNGTVQSGSYVIEIEKFFPGMKVTQEACPMWVPLVENDEYESQGADFFVKKNLKNLLEQDNEIDTVLLACTHYPLLMKKIEESLPGDVKVVSQGGIIAKSLKDYLQRHPSLAEMCSKTGNRSFRTTGEASEFDISGSRFFGSPIESERIELSDKLF